MNAQKKLLTTVICEQSISQEWHIALAKRKVALALEGFALSPLQQAELLTIVSELGYNLFFHAHSGGLLRLSSAIDYSSSSIIIESLDSGPGIVSIESCMKDGFSTNGGLGGGLPGIKRLSDEFRLSQINGGTWVKCAKWLNP